MKQPQPSSRSIVTKKAPTCKTCHQHGHYSSKCPVLAQKLLSALRQSMRSDQIAEAVSSGTLGLKSTAMKAMKTLKRRSRGLRHVQPTRCKRGKKAAEKNRAAEKGRKPRPKKQETIPRRKTTFRAYAALRKARWLRKPPRCRCGGAFRLCSFSSSMSLLCILRTCWPSSLFGSCLRSVPCSRDVSECFSLT